MSTPVAQNLRLALLVIAILAGAILQKADPHGGHTHCMSCDLDHRTG